MAVATQVVAKFTADISDVQSKMAVARGAFGTVAEAASFSSKRIAEVGDAMANVGKKMTVGITLPLGGVAAAASTAAMSFESSMNKIVGLVGIASEEVARMGDEVVNMAGSLGKTPDELADGLFVVTSAGLRGSEAMATLNNAARAGAAGLGETNDIARAVAGALSAYGSEVLSASEATDAIVATARAGNFETSQFAAAIGRVLPFAKQAGATFQDMGGAVALLTRVNGDAAQSITQVQALFRAFVVPTEEAKTALDEVGLSAQDLRDSIAEKGLPATLQMLDRALGGNREQLGRLLGSSEAASAAFQILDSDSRTISDTFGVVANSAGMTAEAFGAVSQTASFQVSQSMAQLKATLIDLGEQFLPIIKSVMDFMQANLKAFSSLPGPVKSFITVMAGILAVMGPLLFIGGKLIIMFSGLLSMMLKMKAIGAMRAAFAGLRGELALTRANMKQTQTSIGMLGTAANTAKVTVVASFRAIATASKALLSSLGPIGIAMVAVGAAFEIFIGQAAGAQHHISNLRDEIDLTTNKMSEAAKIFIASELRTNISQEDLAMMENYGITISGFIAALEQGGPALDAYRDKITAMQEAQKATGGVIQEGFLNVGTVNSINTIVENLDGMIGYYDQARAAAQDAAESQVDAAVAASDAVRQQATQYRGAAQQQRAAYEAMTDKQEEYSKAVEDGIRAIDALSAAFDAMNAVISDEASRDSAIRGIKDLKAALEENGAAIKGTSDEALNNRAAIRDAAQQWIDYAAATKDPEQAQKRLAKGQEEIRAALKKAGIKPKDSDIFKVFKAQQQESGKTVDEFAKQRDIAARYGNDVGKNFIDGIIAELERRKQEVATAAASVTSGLTTGGNAGIDADSPSRDAMKVAGNFVDGIVVGVTRRKKDVENSATELGKRLMRAFSQVLNPPDLGPLQSAMRDVFAYIPSVREAERALQDASWAVADARDGVREAEKRLAEARKEGNAREIAAAERDLARARRDVSDATKALRDAQKGLDLSKFIAQNKGAAKALEQLGRKFDYIMGKLEEVSGAFDSLTELIAKPFGIDSNIFNMFSSEALGIDSLARGATDLIETVTQAFGVLTDPRIVGAAAAERNRERLAGTVQQITDLTEESLELRRKYEANLAALAQLEKDYQAEVKGINDTYDALDKAGQDNLRALEKQLADVNASYERENAKLQALIKERDDLLSNVSKGFRSFVNDFKGALTTGVRVIGQSTQKLADGITLTFDNIEETVSGGGIGASLRKRLDEIKAFAANVRTLVARGLDQSVIREFVEAGPAQAGDIVSALAVAGDDEIREINAIQGELAAQATEFGSYLSDLWFDAGIAAQQAIVDPLEAQKLALESAIADARQYLETLKTLRQNALDEARKAYDEEKKRLEDDNIALLKRMDEIAAEIEGLIAELMATLPAESLQAGKDSMNRLLDGFKERYPAVFKELNGLMNRLARSMERTVTITVRTVYEAAGNMPGRAAGGPVQARTAYLVGERGPEVFVPYSRGNIIPNHELGATPRMSIGTRNGGVVNVAEGAVQINIPGGMIGAPDKLEQYVSDAVERGLADLANEILAS